MNTLLFDFLPDELISIIITYVEKNNSLIRISDRHEKLYDQYVDEIRKGFQMPFYCIDPRIVTVYRSYKNGTIQYSTSSYYYSNPGDVDLTDFYDKESGNPFHILLRDEQFTSSDNKFYPLENSIQNDHEGDNKMRYIIYAYLMFEYADINYEYNYRIVYLSNQANYKYVKINFEDGGWNERKTKSYESKNWSDIWNNLEDSDKEAILYSFFA